LRRTRAISSFYPIFSSADLKCFSAAVVVKTKCWISHTLQNGLMPLLRPNLRREVFFLISICEIFSERRMVWFKKYSWRKILWKNGVFTQNTATFYAINWS
jgi:hypothetical protein